MSIWLSHNKRLFLKTRISSPVKFKMHFNLLYSGRDRIEKGAQKQESNASYLLPAVCFVLNMASAQITAIHVTIRLYWQDCHSVWTTVISLWESFRTCQMPLIRLTIKYYYFTDRQNYVNSCKSNIASLTCGVAQGSIVGPLLFLRYDLATVSNTVFPHLIWRRHIVLSNKHFKSLINEASNSLLAFSNGSNRINCP